MKITIESIPHKRQRYDTVGDWLWFEHDLYVYVSEELPRQEQYLIAVHELVEALLCQANGVTQEDVDKFDVEYQGDGESGASFKAPYRNEHSAAEGIERLFAALLHVDWPSYSMRVDSLSQV